ncbi:MAG: nucleoside hydrolase [Candidatus Latescibacteria bacterium]|jgi:purine nucleosidase|nr:nucleoside hydrolase [Candidatus Latescibacterota bacterium]MBT4141331.1 nucleoside hydrolase [Candidatus Latescibacterota bacterium]
MAFPKLTDAEMIERLQPPTGKVRIVLDTDTYNEVDDQFAVAHALLSPDQMSVEALYAAPFYNGRSDGPADGMERSYDEILRLLDRLNVADDGLVFRGSAGYLEAADKPQESDAVRDLIDKAMSSDELLYVVAIGAITNVASAILLAPEIINKIVVVWLGGHEHHCPSAREFNLKQDMFASQLMFNCGVPFVQIPCRSVASHLLTTLTELEAHVEGKSAVGDFLTETVRGYHKDHFAWAKEIWDISATAYLIHSDWVSTRVVHSPILTDQCTFSHDSGRHFMRTAVHLNRNAIFADLFRKLENAP